MLRTHNCGELTIANVSQTVTLSGWIQKVRHLGGMIFIDLRDRYGITQLAFNHDQRPELCEKVEKMGRECKPGFHRLPTCSCGRKTWYPASDRTVLWHLWRGPESMLS